MRDAEGVGRLLQHPLHRERVGQRHDLALAPPLRQARDDLGVYVVSFAQMVLGTPDTVTANGSLFPSGVDAEATLLLGHADGRAAAVTCSLRGALPGQARVFGTQGWVDVLPRFHHPQTIVLHRAGRDPETITRPQTGGGYSHELIEVTRCLQEGRTESDVMPLADTLAVQAVLQQAADQLGVPHRDADMDLG